VAERDALLRLVPLVTDAAEAADLHDRLADVCERAGDLAGAVAAAEAARRAAPSAARLDASLRLARRGARPGEVAALLAERARAALAAGEAAVGTDLLLERAALVGPSDPALALAALAEARAASPGDAAVLRAQAELADRTGDFRLALGCLRALLAASPPDAPALELSAARAALAAGEAAAAREHAERALEGGAAGAAEVLDELLERIGDDAARAEVLSRLGRHLEAAALFERAGDPPRARAALERAAADPALAPQALPRLADLRLAEDDRPGAALALLDLARLTPGCDGARLALRAHHLGRDPAALDVAAERDPCFAPARAARARLRAGDDPGAALADAEAALAGEGLDDGERPGLLVLAAHAAAAAGDGAAARRHLAAYCEAHPGDDDALSRLAALHRAAGAHRELAEVLARRLELASGAEAVQVRVELSDLVAAEDPAAGARLALEALALDSSSFAALRALATPPRAAHVPASDRTAILRGLAERAEATPEEAAAAHGMRARLLAQAGDPGAALEAARAAARIGDEDDEALELRAALAGSAGDAAEAARALLARAGRAADRREPGAAGRLAEAGLAALAAGDGEGEDALRRALRLGPDRESARAALEALAARARDRGDASAEREALASLVPLLPTRARPAALLRRSALELAAGDAAAARASAEEARALAPRDAGAVETCRAAAAADGDGARAAELLGVLAELEPASAGPRLLERARLLAAVGDDEAADGAYVAALAALPAARPLADEHARHRRERLGGRGAAAPLEAFAGRAADRMEAAHALRVAAAMALAAGEPGVALRCARRAYARTQEDLAFAAPLLARILYLSGGGAEALVLHRRLLDAGLPSVAPEDAVVLCRQTAELAEDAGEPELARQAYDRLLELRPQELDAALRRFELEPDRARAVRDLADAAETCRSQRQRVLALVRAADAALREAYARDLGERLFRRARRDAARDPALAAWIARRHAAAVRAADGASSPAFLEAIHDASAAAQAAGDRAGARELLEEAIAVERERGLFGDAARDLLHLDALAAAEGDFAESPARLRAAGALLREAGDPGAAAEVLRRAYAANPGSEETARLLDEAARAMGGRGAPLRVELQADRAARAEAGPARAEALVALADAHRAAGAPLQAEAALRAALADVPDHEAAEQRLLDLLGDERRPADRARLLLARAERADPGAALAHRRAAAEALAASPDPCDRALAAEAWGAVVAAAPGDLGAARAAARLLLELGRREEAIPLLARVVRTAPDDDEATSQLDGAYAARHREQAELFVLHAEQARGEIRAARLREAARGFFAAGDHARARAVLVEAFEAWPADSAAFSEALRDASPDVERTDAVLLARARAAPAEAAACHRARADALRAFGEPERAIAAYEEARAADPADVEVLASLASCVAASRGDGAARELDREVVAAWEAAPASVEPGVEAPSRYRLGLARVREGAAADAVSHLERAVVLSPGDARAAEAWSALARGYADRGDTASALAAARARVSRAAAGGSDAELRAAQADAAALAAELAVSAAPPPSVLAPPQPDGSDPQDEAPLFPSLPEEDAPLFDALPEAVDPALDEPARVEPPLGASPADGEDPRAAALAAAERASALEEPRERAAAWIEAAEALARARADAREVRAALDPACEVDADSPEPWRARARLEALLGDASAAARCLLSASIRAEGDDAARTALEAARLFEEGGRHLDALRAYRAALHADPGCIPEDALRAAEALGAGDASGAADLLARIDPAALPADWRTLHARKLARALDAAGRSAEAERAWLELFRASRADVEAFSRAAAHALTAGGVDAWMDLAAEHEQALGASGMRERRRDLRSERGRLFARAGRLEAARGALLAALELDPGHAPTLEALAALEGRAEDWGRTAATLWDEAAAAADPAESAAVYLRLGRILSERLGDEGGAVAALRASLARAGASRSPAAARCAADAQALLAEMGGNAAAAQAPADAPPTAPTLDGVAVLLRGQADAASGAGRADLLERLAAHLERIGDAAGTAEALADAVEADPPGEGAWSRLAAIVPEGDPRRQRAAEARARAAGPEASEAAPAAGPANPWVALEEGAPERPEGAGAAGETSFAFEAAAAGAGAAPAGEREEEPAPEAWSEAETEGLLEALAFDAGGVAEPAEVEPALPPIGSGDAEEHARDGRLRLEAGDLAGAYARLSVALAREPSDLYVARDLARVAERLGLFEEYVRLGEACADAIAAQDPLAAAARYRHFAEVLRDRLGQTDRAGVMLEKALALVPEDVDTRRELVQLWGSHAATAHRALEIWLDLARAEPTDADALAGIAEVSGRIAARASPDAAVRETERGRIAASLAAFVAPGAHVPPPPARLAAQVASELRARVAAPGAVGPLARLLGVLAPWLEPLFPADLARRGASPADGLAPDRAPRLVATFDAAARALRTRPHRTFLSSLPGVEIAVENCQPPAVIVSPAVTELPAAALAFLAARTLDLLDHGWTLAGKFAPGDVAILLELACRFGGGDPAPRGLPAERAGAFLHALEAQVPPGVRAQALELGPAAAAELAGVDPRAFKAALRRTANRVGLLYCGDPGQALRALSLLDRRLEAGPVDPRRALALPDLRDLALLALSEPFLDLRTTGVG
jgi:tetratricopeptide (TPR) repeat protein